MVIRSLLKHTGSLLRVCYRLARSHLQMKLQAYIECDS